MSRFLACRLLLVQAAALFWGPETPAGSAGGPLVIRVTGSDYEWHIRYPGPDGVLDTEDDRFARRNLHLPAGTAVVLDLRSDDYVYSLFLPEQDVLETAVPGMPYEVLVEAGTPGSFELIGSQMCGYTHPLLLGEVVIEAAEDFRKWLARQASQDASSRSG